MPAKVDARRNAIHHPRGARFSVTFEMSSVTSRSVDPGWTSGTSSSSAIGSSSTTNAGTTNNNNVGNAVCYQPESTCTLNTGTSGFCVPFSMASNNSSSGSINNNNSNNNNVYNFNYSCQVLPMVTSTSEMSTCTQYYSSCSSSSSSGSSTASVSLCLPTARKSNGTLVFTCSSLPSMTASTTQLTTWTPTSTAAIVTCYTREVACNLNGASTGYCLPYAWASGSTTNFNYACQPVPVWVNTMPESTCTQYYSSCAASSAAGSSSASATLCLPSARKPDGTFVFACSALPSTIATTTVTAPPSTVAVVTCYTREIACSVSSAVTGYCLPYSPAGASFTYACQPLPVWVNTMPESTCTQYYAACSAVSSASSQAIAQLCLPWARKPDGTFVFKCAALPSTIQTSTISSTKAVTFSVVYNSAPATAVASIVLLVALALQF